MPEPENVEPKTQAKENTFDPSKFKEEMMNEQREASETMMNDLLAKVTNTIDEKLSTIKSTKIDKVEASELSDELELLGIDEKQAAAIVSLVQKRGASVNGNEIEKNILDKVTKSVETKDKQKDLNAQTAAKYPDVLNKTSKLWREAQKIYNSFDESVKSSYMATSLAVESAANKLGITPIDLNSIRAGQAQNNTYGGGKTATVEKKITQKSLDFAASFGVDPKVYERHLKDKM